MSGVDRSATSGETPRCSPADPRWLFGWPGIPGRAKTRVKHEAREVVFALDPHLRKKPKQTGLLRPKVKREFRTAARFQVGDERPGGMQVQDGGEVIAKAHEVAEGPHDDAELLTRLAVRLGDA